MTSRNSVTQRTAAPTDQQRPYITESSAFVVWLTEQRQHAVRVLEDLHAEIAGFETEIQARLSRVRDIEAIVLRANAALALVVPDTTPPGDDDADTNS